MKEETMQKILSGEKKTFRVMGYTYRIMIDLDDRSVELIPVGRGSGASSTFDATSYSYDSGGRVFREAVDIAKEITEHLPQDTDE